MCLSHAAPGSLNRTYRKGAKAVSIPTTPEWSFLFFIRLVEDLWIRVRNWFETL